MIEQLDTSTFDFAAAMPKLRDDLKVNMKTEGGDPYCVLEDAAQNRFFRIGFAEYTLISLFDGKTTISDAVQASSYILGVEALNEREAAQICDWMISNGLAQTRASVSANRISEVEDAERRKKWVNFKNPLMIQMPLWTSDRVWNPDRFFSLLLPMTGWLVSFFGALLWIVAVCCGVYAFASTTKDIQSSIQNVLSANQWLSLAAVGILLKMIHELAHGLACKRFGGKVSEVGVFWFLFIPLPYVDVSSSWGFDRSRRMLVAAAGILAELFVVAIAVMVWSRTGYGLVNQLAAQTILLGSLITILFNANPLMRFDGYFLLSDALRIPNLAVHGRNWIMGVLKRLFFGIRAAEPLQENSFVVPCYGLLALLWQFVVITSILFAASNLMTGLGLVLVLLGLFLWLLVPVGRMIAFVTSGAQLRWRNRLQFSLVVVFISGVVYGAAVWLPSPEYISIEVVARYQDERVARNATAGFVDELLVERGQTVKLGDPILKLKNPELELKRKFLCAQKEFVVQEIRAAKALHDIAKVKSLGHQLTHIQEEIRETNSSLEDLVVKSPADGLVIAKSDLREWEGRYLNSGTDVCQVVRPDQKKLTGLLAEADVDQFDSTYANCSRLIVWGSRSYSLKNLPYQINPSSTRHSPHFALTSMAGGSQTVVNAESVTVEDPDSWVLAKSSFEINLPLPESIGRKLNDGQRCLIKIRARRQTLGTFLREKLAHWSRSRVSLTHGI